jgi:hypothetical protein
MTMMTKPDHREQTEILDDGPVAPADAQVREHLDVILASDEFCSSRRASGLMQHLVERALTGDADSLKERLLGVDIFHRRSDYDTSTDSIVRVTANDVRRRLAQFYTRHPVQPVRISLPLGSYIPDFITTTVSAPHSTLPGSVFTSPSALAHTELRAVAGIERPAPAGTTAPARVRVLPGLLYMLGLVLALLLGWWSHSIVRERGGQTNKAYTFYNDLLGPIGLNGPGKTEIALTNPRVLLYHGLNNPGPALGASLKDIPVPADMAAVLNKSANDNQADFPYHHFFVDFTNYTGIGESKAAFGLARTLEATGRSAELTEERFLNWETARQEQLVILGAPHESKFVQDTLSAANFTIDYDSIHNAHPLPGEQAEYARSRSNDVLEDYGLIWMTRSPSGTRILVLAGLTSAGTAGVGEFFSDPQRMWPVYQQLRAAAGSQGFPDSWQVLVRIQAREDVPVSVTPIAVRITHTQQK